MPLSSCRPFRLLTGARCAALLGVLFLAGGCAGEPDAAPPPPDAPAQSPGGPAVRLPYEAKPPFFSPGGGPPGSEVLVWMSGLPAGATVGVGFGTLVGHEIIARGQADADGEFSQLVRVPEAAPPERSHYFFLADSNELPIAVSNAFLVTRPDGTARIQGEITDEGVECPVMRGLEDEVYSLTGEVGTLTPGTMVVVEAALVETSICQQGLTLEVRSLEVRP